MNRKLVRPRVSDYAATTVAVVEPALAAAEARNERSHLRAETIYYLEQMKAGAHVAVVLNGGEQVRGRIGWYDRRSVKILRDNAPDLLLFKHSIRFMHQADADGGALGGLS